MLKDTDKIYNMANSIRMLSAEMVENAKSGHPGTPIGAADIMACLFSNFVKVDPKNPDWHNRDRFVLSVGHASAMLYSTLHLLGYEKFTLDSLKNLRQLHSITHGHPEVNVNAGIEVTTGPLGQGVAMAVGMAIAERKMNAEYPDITNHHTYVLVGDGCMMEGVSYEALSLAGHLKLNKLVVIYDSNNISIDGNTNLSTSENIDLRMQSFGFDVISINGNDIPEINKALETAQSNTKPTFIIAHTKIAYKAGTKEGTAASHGSPLGRPAIDALKASLNWAYEPFEVPTNITDLWKVVAEQNNQEYKAWENKFNASPKKEEFIKVSTKANIANVTGELNKLAHEAIVQKPNIATRVASGKVLEVLQAQLFNIIGGSADLSGSNNTISKNSVALDAANYGGNYIHYGIREHAMAALMNGIACYDEGLIPYAGTFLIFSDYMRPSIRLSALMKKQVIYVLTHDSISLGGDGPTHQPIEHVGSLMMMPDLEVLRPADLVETVEAYKIALSNTNKPTVIVLGRSNVPTIIENYDAENNRVEYGGYVLLENQNATINLVSSGSEIHLCIPVIEELKKQGIIANLISMPSVLRFSTQSEEYKQSVLGDRLNIVVEPYNAALYKDVLEHKTILYDIRTFGESGNPEDVLDYFGFTSPKILDFILKQVRK